MSPITRWTTHAKKHKNTFPAYIVPRKHGLRRYGRAGLDGVHQYRHAGFHRGYAGPDGVRISAKHTLALVNDGNGTTEALLTLAREIRDQVYATFSIPLTPEPILIGATL